MFVYCFAQKIPIFIHPHSKMNVYVAKYRNKECMFGKSLYICNAINLYRF